MSTPPDAGQRLSHYEMGDVLGEGGMGAVYRATDMRSGVAVALKLVDDLQLVTAIINFFVQVTASF